MDTAYAQLLKSWQSNTQVDFMMTMMTIMQNIADLSIMLSIADFHTYHLIFPIVLFLKHKNNK